MKPVIGIIVCGFMENKQFVSEPYVDAIIQSGGIPIIIPYPLFNADKSSLNTLFRFYNTYYDCVDAFLFCGGDDITPALFNQPPLNNLGKTDIRIDLFQITFMEFLLERTKPILGICRGMQIINLALGGTLYQDLSLRERYTFSHMQNTLSRSDISHPVTFSIDSKLYDIFGGHEYTNSFHHQAIQTLGKKLIACGHTNDGIIEAVEVTNHPFAIGVQWHPECMYETSKTSQQLFRIFISHSTHTN